jgi:uncharacterized protein
MWKTLSEVPIEDIVMWVHEASSAGQEVHIGTDSLQTGRFTQFVAVIAIHTPGRGGRAAYHRETVPRITSLRERLLREVYKSTEVGLSIGEVPGTVTIHIDANPEERHMSSRYIQELVGLVLGQGFKHKVKPEAWCATHAADHCVRHLGKHKTPQYTVAEPVLYSALPKRKMIGAS